MKKYLDELTARYPVLTETAPAIGEFIEMLISLYRADGTFFVAGNGGSGADAEHICGELLKGFCRKRPLDAAALAELKNCGDDVDPDLAFAQQVWALGKAGDLMLGISTGGNASNIRKAFITARAKNMKTVLLTGNRHGICEKYADIVIAVPEKETFKIQELHLPIYHTVCLAVEAAFFNE